MSERSAFFDNTGKKEVKRKKKKKERGKKSKRDGLKKKKERKKEGSVAARLNSFMAQTF